MTSIESLKRGMELEQALNLDINNLNDEKTYPIIIEKTKCQTICVGYVKYDYRKGQMIFKEFEKCDKNYESECDDKNCYKRN